MRVERNKIVLGEKTAEFKEKALMLEFLGKINKAGFFIDTRRGGIVEVMINNHYIRQEAIDYINYNS